ncbi:MAG: outer membrane protein assembly factor BamA [Candidatus Hydrogenedentes bacterium]|nr:outer membrane protein assembly factor BamA [Candidatus Hydrogenedentota bacterium]
MNKLLAGCVFLLLGGALCAHAQDYSGRTVNVVNISGLERINDQTVRSKLEVQPGQAYNARAIARDIRRLYELGYFSLIKADAVPDGDGVALTYMVEEKRAIDEIRIVGNDKIKDRAIQAKLNLHVGDSFLPEAYDQERKAIIELYESKGFANTTVDIIAEKIGPSRVRLTYNINEGRKARIRSIQVVGNDVLSDHKIKKVMKTRRSWWFLGGKYAEPKFEDDLKHILDAYGDEGRLEAEIAKTDVVYTDSGKGMNITIYLEEGPEYHVEVLEVANNEVYDDDEVLQDIKVQAGDVHNKSQVTADAAKVQQDYQDSGYVNAAVTPQVTLDRENKTTHVVQDVEEGDLKYIKEVKVTGNDLTKDEIIRREMMLAPGERFDGTAAQDSQRRLENTGYFETVRLGVEDIPGDDLYSNLLLDVDEGDTGMFNFGAGFSTEDGLGGFGELTLNNFDIKNWPTFAGGGQQLHLRLAIGERRNQYSLSFTEPQFLGYPVSAGFDLFDESYKVQGGQDYDEQQQGAQIRFGKVLSPYVQARVSLRYVSVDNSELPFFIHREIREWRGESSTLSTRWQLERNTIDRYRDPSSGSRHLLTLELAGLGGDNDFIKLEHDSLWYHSLTEDDRWVLSFRTREGYVTEYGDSDSVPLQDRFYAGGSTTVRGYDIRDIGPKVRQYYLFGKKFNIGGDYRWITNLELKYAATEKLRLYTFVDSGGVWQDSIELGEIKYSAGLGLGIDVPRFGPLRFDYGIPLNPDDDQGNGRFHFVTGFRF